MLELIINIFRHEKYRLAYYADAVSFPDERAIIFFSQCQCQNYRWING